MILTRAYLELGTIGRLTTAGGQPTLYVLERPWLGNAPFTSCIPEGKYLLIPHSGTHWKDVLELPNVPGRSAILIHPANRPSELAGCLAPGLDYDIEGHVPTVVSSRDAFEIVMRWYRAGDRMITITHTEAKL